MNHAGSEENVRSEIRGTLDECYWRMESKDHEGVERRATPDCTYTATGKPPLTLKEQIEKTADGVVENLEGGHEVTR